jgi:hypothetical protein
LGHACMHHRQEEIVNSLFKFVEGRLVYLIGRASIKPNKREITSDGIPNTRCFEREFDDIRRNGSSTLPTDIDSSFALQAN